MFQSAEVAICWMTLNFSSAGYCGLHGVLETYPPHALVHF